MIPLWMFCLRWSTATILAAVTLVTFVPSPGLGAGEAVDLAPGWTLSAEYAWQHWTPTQISSASYETSGLNLLAIELRGSEQSPVGRFLPVLRFEWTPDRTRAQERLIEIIEQQRRQFWRRILARLYLRRDSEHPDRFFARIWLAYDEQTFIAEVTTQIDRLYDGEPLAAGQHISQMTRFRRLELGLYEGPTTGATLGLAYTNSRKPYSMTLLGRPLDDDIHDAEFHTWGMSFGFRDRNPAWSLGLRMDGGWFALDISDGGTLGLGERDSKLFIEFAADLAIRRKVQSWLRVGFAFEYLHRHFYHDEIDKDGARESHLVLGNIDINNDTITRLGVHALILF
jgi:hypothetical protein